MARTPRSIVPEEPKEASVWSAIVLMASSVGAYALLALFLAYNHPWTDALLGTLPALTDTLRPGNDGIVAEQLRVTDIRTEHLTLSGRSVALLFEATIVNDASLPVRRIVLEVEGFRDGQSIARATGTCGKNVSVRLIRRLTSDEVTHLMEMDLPDTESLASGARTGCQVALTPLRTEIDEVSFRIASAEPTPDHLATSQARADLARQGKTEVGASPIVGVEAGQPGDALASEIAAEPSLP